MKSFFKKYKLRYLFYRRMPASPIAPDWQIKYVCLYCKKGSSLIFLVGGKQLCSHCLEPLIEVKNKSAKYILWKLWSPISEGLFSLLQFLHIVKSSYGGRYSMFGDESRYVAYKINVNTQNHQLIKKKRKWFEYIFIRR